ncbi:unnamed protein product, partial [Brenthis ino]
MGVGLQPLEFTECLADSPHFRENLQRHEKELERTSQQIKRLIKEVKDVVQAAKRLGTAQLALAASMEQFEFACIGASLTEDELVIGRSLQQFAQLIRTIEDERDRMVGRAHEQIIQPLERFRKEHIGAVKEGKKKFDKKTAKFCQSQERTLSLSTKKPEAVFQEADAAMDMAERDFCQASLEYVFQLQAVQERKKFELVETLLGFVFGWWTFHHTAHDVHADAEPLVRDLQLRIQRTRNNFEETSKQTESLMKKMMEVRQMTKEDEGTEDGSGGVSRAGYLFLMEKKAFGTTWSKQYCTYEKASRTLSLVPYNQINVKTVGGAEAVALRGARGAAEAERRFCWEALPAERERAPLTLQALGERDRAAWLRALDALAPLAPADAHDAPRQVINGRLAAGVAGGGRRGRGGRRVGARRRGVRVRAARDRRAGGARAGGAGAVPRGGRGVQGGTPGGAGARAAPARRAGRPAGVGLAHAHVGAQELPARASRATAHAPPAPPVAGRCQAGAPRRARRRAARARARALPPRARDMLRLVLAHLARVAARCDRNLMSASNLAVCFGPTLLRAEHETVASIFELKFYNVLVEALLDNFDVVFADEPPAVPAPPPPAPPPPAPHAPHAHNGLLGTSPSSIPISSRNDIISSCGAASYSPHHHQLLQQFTAHGRAARCSSSSESVSSHSASPPPHAARAPLAALAGLPPPHAFPPRTTRVRTLYACLGESEGELSFEPNQIITNVTMSAEPGWLRGTLNGKSGLVPQNYVEPLP